MICPKKYLLNFLFFALVIPAAAVPVQRIACAQQLDHTYQNPFIDATDEPIPYGLDAGRIVSLAPNLTEMVYALELGERLVGRTDFCNYPPEVLELPTVGGFVDTSLEQVVTLRPDLVLAYQGNSLELVTQLRMLDITVLTFDEPDALSVIFAQMDTLWKVAGSKDASRPERLEGLIEQFRSYAEQAGNVTNNVGEPRPVVFFGYPGENTLTCGNRSFLDDLMRLAGARNAAGEVAERWPVVSAEFVVNANPDWILTATPCSGSDDLAKAKTELLEQLRADPVWASLDAVRNGNVLVLDADILLRPGPRIVIALQQLGEALEGSSAGSGDDQT